MGDADRAWELFSHAESHPSRRQHPEEVELYKVEPYVMSADVYAVAPHTGRGGWTWYTGAAGWMYRLAVETLMGLHLEVDRLRLAPLVPDEWDSYKIHYRYRETFYHITMKRSEGGSEVPETEVRGTGATSVRRISLDGADLEQVHPLKGTIPLVDDRRDHQVEVELG